MLASTKKGVPQWDKERAMQHVCVKEGSALDSHRNILNHDQSDRSSFGFVCLKIPLSQNLGKIIGKDLNWIFQHW